jgi:predicted small secreted protein
MKKRILPGGFLLLAIALIAIGAILISTGCNNVKGEGQSITVLNPAISTAMVERVPLAPRADTLEGKTIYLVDLQWGGPEAGYSVFEEMKKWFAKNKPSIKVELKRASGGWMGNDPALQKEIADNKAAGVVIGIGG